MHRHLRRVRLRVPRRPAGRRDPLGARPRPRAAPVRTGRRSGCSARPTTPPASARARRASPGCWRPCRPASTASTASGASPTSTPRPSACSAARGRTCSAGCSGTTGPAAINSIFEDSYRTAVRTGVPVSFDAYYPAPLDGWFELRAWPTPDGLSVYFLEITERRRMQEQADRSARAAGDPRPGGSRAGRHAGRRRPPSPASPRLVVPALADFAVVTLVDPDGRPRDVGCLARRPGARRGARALRGRAPGVDAGDLARGPRAGQRRGDPRADGRTVSTCSRRARRGTCCRPRDPRPSAVLPMRGRGRTLGLLTLYFRAGSAVDAEDLATAQDVADRAGLALDNARLYNAQQAARRGAAAQPAHRAPAARPRRDRRALPARGRGGPGRRRLVRRVPAARRRDHARHRRRRRPRHRRRRGHGAAARPAARHRHLQRRRARRRSCAGWTRR